MYSNIDRSKIDSSISENLCKMKALADYISLHPEVSGEEEETSKYLVDFLREEGYEVEFPYKNVRNSFRAYKGKVNNKPKVALMCEYDALPDIGHGCGHSLSGAASILAATVLIEQSEELPFEIELLGTPDEEENGGKIALLKNGAFDDYVFAAMAHFGPDNLPYDYILASIALEFSFKGTAAHASEEPWNGKSALNANMLMIHAMDMVRQYMTRDCQLHGIITEGGQAPNIVPDESKSVFYPRAGSVKSLKRLMNQIDKCANGAAIATETEYSTEYLCEMYTELYTADTAKKLMDNIFESLGFEYIHKDVPSGSLDAGNVSLKIPVFHPYIQISKDVKLYTHTKEFADFIITNEANTALANAAKVLCEIVLRLASDSDILKKIIEEQNTYIKENVL